MHIIEELKERLADELYKLELAELYNPDPTQLEEYYNWMQEQHDKIINLSKQIRDYEESNNSVIDFVCH